MHYSDLDLLYRPTLASTLRQMCSVSLSIWQDYRDFNRIARRQQRMARKFALSPTRWQEDRCHVAVACVVLVGIVGLGLYMVDAWAPLLALLGVA